MARYSVALLVLCLLVGSHATTTKPQQQETAASKDLCEVSTWVLRFSCLIVTRRSARSKASSVKFWLGSEDIIKIRALSKSETTRLVLQLILGHQTREFFFLEKYCDSHKY